MQTIAKDCFKTKHNRFGQRPSMVATVLLPFFAPDLANLAKVFISNVALGLRRCPSPDLRIFARRDCGSRPSTADSVVAGPLIIGPICADLRNRTSDIFDQIRE